jgi:translation elongation factor EF-Ts
MGRGIMIKRWRIKLIREETDADYLEAKNVLDSCNNNVFDAINSIREKRKHLSRIAKKFKQIFHRDMTLGGLQDLQDEVNLINPVDSYLENQVAQIRKANEPKKNVSGSRAVRQEYTQGKSVTGKTVQIETEKKGVGI